MVCRVYYIVAINIISAILLTSCSTDDVGKRVEVVRNEGKIFDKDAVYTSHGGGQKYVQYNNMDVMQEESSQDQGGWSLKQNEQSNEQTKVIHDESQNSDRYESKNQDNKDDVVAAGTASAVASSATKTTTKPGEEELDISSMSSSASNKNNINKKQTLSDAQNSSRDNASYELNESSDSNFRTATPLNSSEFMWPVRGKVSKHYSKKPGMQNEGVNILAPMNAPVHASANGTVVYVGFSDKYGHLLIIKHKDSYFSAYSHLAEINVKSGQEVMKGEIIGKVGKSGNVNEPQIHFSMRKNKITIDPEASR